MDVVTKWKGLDPPRSPPPVMLEKTKFLLEGGRIQASVYLVAGYEIDSASLACNAID
jgi:hypothetical protein